MMNCWRFFGATLGVFLSLLWAGSALAQPIEPKEVLLSPIELTESKDTIDHITQVDMERKTATNLWEALRGVMGVYQQTSGGRNEGTVSIRGATRYQIGMYIDDIPIATAYRNEWDFNNTLLFDLESIEVSKGYSSPLLTSNNSLAGTINLRTAKPTKALDFSVRYINFFDRRFEDQGRLFSASVGTKQDLFYLKATVTLKEQDFFTLPSNFAPSPFEDGGRRENSDNKNRSLNFIAGWTPKENVDIMFGFVRQSFEKGQPFDAAQSYTSPPYSSVYPYARFWRWPEYETTRYYVNANIGLTENSKLKLVAYHDKHKDTSIDYYTVDMLRRGWPDKTYDQSTSGAQATYEYAFNKAHKVALSIGYRELSHEEYNDYDNFDDTGLPNNRGKQAADVGKPLDERMVESYWDVGAEYTFKPIDPLTLVFGASYSSMKPKTLEARNHTTGQMISFKDGLDSVKDLFNYQLGVFYNVTDQHEIFATFAKKARFATMRERYTRASRGPSSGAAMNSDLDPERATHYEVGYRGLIGGWLKINSSLYFSEVKDLITSQRDPDGNTFYVNLDKANFFGFELGAEALFNQYVKAGAVFNFLKWDNRSNNNNNLTQLPKFTSVIYSVISPTEGLSITPQVNMSSGFYWDSDPLSAYGQKSPSYVTADFKIGYDVNERLSFEFGIKNVFDKEYAFSGYYPEPGRNFFLGVTGRY
ncbi:MAG: TonB-dependent receptor [Deltaproteobacteria bacterium]|jgi:iron complex outermembrane receptor protein|nr:TonB-dependent receptor [Deltaproteobacteria bacterium]